MTNGAWRASCSTWSRVSKVVQALVPLKDLVAAKSRLAGLLRPSERRALAQAMAEDVLTVLRAHPEVSRITLVSDDPGAELLAAKYGARCWPERSLGCRGLNAVIRRASEKLLAGFDAPLLVLHADLPLLAGADIDAALDAWRTSGGLVIGCDRAGTGTNLLLFDRGSLPAFCFGPDSCARHRDSARTAGLPVRVLRRPGIELDVDEPLDLKRLLGRLPPHAGGNTVRVLYNGDLGRRVAAALATLPDIAGPVDNAEHRGLDH